MKRSESAMGQTVLELQHKFGPRSVILMYHRIAEVDSDPWSLCVTPRHFAEHLEVLRKRGRTIQVRQLAESLENGKVPRRSVVVTFDDGYADNLYNAKPLLEHYDVRATVFLVTSYVGLKQEFWWDELERLLLQPGRLPETLRLTINGSTYHWELGEAVRYSEDAYLSHRSWRTWEDAPSSRHSLYFSLWRLLRPLPESERRAVLDKLLAWAGAEPAARSTHRALSREEVLVLARQGLIEIGSHTMTHPLLSTCPSTAQREEIQRSKAELEEVLGCPVTSFAYPYGDYTGETIALVREAGFACACSTSAAVVGPGTDRFQLPRVQVHDWSREEFAGQLSMWLDG